MHLTVRGLAISILLIAAIIGQGAYQHVLAQTGATTGSITGVLTDEQGGVLGGAVVAARNINTNLTVETNSNEDGSYTLLNLPPSVYEITVNVEGFKPHQARIDLALGNVVRANFTLKVSATEGEVIEVRASNSLDERKTESSTNIDEDRILNLPINQRNFLDFALTSARVTLDRLPPNGITSTSGISFNGQSARLNNVTVDGSNNNEEFTGGVRSTFSQEAVQEFQIVSDSYSAEFGRAVGGVVNIVTKSGTNEYHGTIFNFLRNDELSARDAFLPVSDKPEFKQYQFGATIGGPIVKDKAFFFTSFERLSLKQNSIITIPNDFVVSANRQGFPEVTNGAVPFAQGITNVLVRGDIQISPKDRFVIRYNGGFKFDGAFETIGGFAAGLQSNTTSGIQRLDENTINLQNTYVSGNFVNETRFLVTSRDQIVESADPGQPLNILFAGGVGQVTFGNNFLTPSDRFLDVYQVTNNAGLQLGRHLLRFGGDFGYTRLPDNKSSFPINNFGSYIFADLPFAQLLGNPAFPFVSALQAFDPARRTPAQRGFLGVLAQVLASRGLPLLPLADIALPVVFVQTFGTPRTSVDQKVFSAFIQEEFKAKPNLVLKAGARYDVFRTTNFRSQSGNIAPRVAFSYNPGFAPKLNVHGSYGIFFGGPPALQLAFIIGAYDGRDGRLDQAPAKNQFFFFPLSLFSFQLPGKRFSDSNPPPIPLIPQLRQTFQPQPDFKAAYSHQATFGFNVPIGNLFRLGVEYNLVRGLRLYSNRNINPVVRPIPGDPLTSSIIGRVDPSKGLNIEIESAFDSYYHGLTLLAERRLSNRVNFLVSYTFSKAIDNYFDFRTDLQGEQDPLKPGLERSLSLQDIRGRVIASATWDLSYTKNPFLRDFAVSMIFDASSGRPFNLVTGSDTNMNGESVPLDRPTFIGRNAGRTPGFASFDFRLTRSVTFNERFRLQGTVEFFNLFNRVNISSFNNVFPPQADGSFALPPQEDGRFIVTEDRFTGSFRPRQIQLGFRFFF